MAVVLRATQKVLKSLTETSSDEDQSGTALGDWYVNRIVVSRQPILLFMSERGFLTISMPARDVKGLAARFPDYVSERLERLGLSEDLIHSEVRAMAPVLVGKTRSQSLLAQMAGFARALPQYLGGSQLDFAGAERTMEQTPCQLDRHYQEMVVAEFDVPRLLVERWSSDGSGQAT